MPDIDQIAVKLGLSNDGGYLDLSTREKVEALSAAREDLSDLLADVVGRWSVEHGTPVPDQYLAEALGANADGQMWQYASREFGRAALTLAAFEETETDYWTGGLPSLLEWAHFETGVRGIARILDRALKELEAQP